LLAAISIRLLQLGAGFLVYYGSTAMLTTDGLRPPNVIVLLGLLVVALATLSASRAEHRPLASLWVAAMVVALPHALWSIAHLADVPCPPEHPPLGGSYYCVPPGAQVVLILSTITLAFALVGASSDARALATRLAG